LAHAAVVWISGGRVRAGRGDGAVKRQAVSTAGLVRHATGAGVSRVHIWQGEHEEVDQGNHGSHGPRLHSFYICNNKKIEIIKLRVIMIIIRERFIVLINNDFDFQFWYEKKIKD
jgi:hypothetical protein